MYLYKVGAFRNSFAPPSNKQKKNLHLNKTTFVKTKYTFETTLVWNGLDLMQTYYCSRLLFFGTNRLLFVVLPRSRGIAPSPKLIKISNFSSSWYVSFGYTVFAYYMGKYLIYTYVIKATFLILCILPHQSTIILKKSVAFSQNEPSWVPNLHLSCNLGN